MTNGRRRPRPRRQPAANPALNPNSTQAAGDGGVDLISTLPDEVRSHILLFLNVEEAVRGKLLSRKWRHIYPAYPKLAFYAMRGFLDIFPSFNSRPEWSDNPEKFVIWVDEAMHQFKAPKLKEFEVYHILRDKFSRYMDGWIKLACEMNVDKISILSGETPKPYIFPLHLLPTGEKSHVKHLNLERCTLTPFSSLAGPLTSLRTLELHSVSFSKGCWNFDEIASRCPYLENLNIGYFEALPDIQRLCSQMRYLKFLGISSETEMENVKIHDVNLTGFEYRGPMKNFSFSGLNRLKKVDMICRGCTSQNVVILLSRLSKGARHLKSLDLGIIPLKFFESPLSLPTFMCLKRLDFSVDATSSGDLRSLSKFLEFAPLLQKFISRTLGRCEEVMPGMWFEEEYNNRKRGDNFVHSHLKEVEIVRLSGSLGRDDVELALKLLKVATSLEKMILRCVPEYFQDELRSVLAESNSRVEYLITEGEE